MGITSGLQIFILIFNNVLRMSEVPLFFPHLVRAGSSLMGGRNRLDHFLNSKELLHASAELKAFLLLTEIPFKIK